MLKSVRLTHFTVFEDTTFEFSPGLNVLIGDNGTGKTHCLKAGYALMRIGFDAPKESGSDNVYKFPRIFQSIPIKSLCRENKAFTLRITHPDDCGEFVRIIKYHKNTDKTVETIEQRHTPNIPQFSMVFIPSKEILSMYPNFIPLYEKYHLAFDETYYDLCKVLENPLLRKPDNVAQQLLSRLETLIGGKVRLQGGQFYLQFSEPENLMEINRTAEGHRKLALLAYLIANDSIRPHTTLFWDEPESNLNPRLMRQLAAALAALAKHGVQVILATHSYFLMKELSLLTQQDRTVPARFFSLLHGENGVEVEQGERLADLLTVVSLDEELDQCDRDQALYYAAKETA